jgi:hypothetical protein
VWPAYVAAILAVVALAVGLVLALAGARRAAVGCAVAVGVFAVVGVGMYAVAEARYESCVENNGIAEDAEAVVVGRHYCYRKVFGRVRGDVVR